MCTRTRIAHSTRVSTDLLHDIMHREQDLKKEAKKVDELGRTAERSKTLEQFYATHFKRRGRRRISGYCN